MPSQFRLEQVSLRTTFQTLLEDISFQIYAGDRVALIGPSGAGKTSLLRLLNRLSEISQGQIYFEDQDLRRIPVLKLRQQVLLVPQESKLLGMTVREALAYPLVLRNSARSTIQQQVSHWMEQLHIPSDWLERTEVQLSVGQRQLVSIARALIAQPKVLLLDEPTSALDAGRGAHVLDVISQVAQSQQMTVVMVNHQLDLAQQFCDRLLYLQQGKLVEDQAAERVNWAGLTDRLVQAEAALAQEWE